MARALVPIDPLRADPSRHPEMLDAAIALLTTARGRHPTQVSTLIEASQILLGAIADVDPDYPILRAPLAKRERVVVSDDEKKPRRRRRAKKARSANGGGHGRKARSARPTPKAASEAPVSSDTPATTVTSSSKAASEIHVNLTADEESVEFRGRTIEVTTQQARLFDLLAKGMPQPIDRKFLARKLFPGQAAASADTSLSTLCTSCKPAAAAVGLQIKTVPGVGVALQPAPEASA